MKNFVPETAFFTLFLSLTLAGSTALPQVAQAGFLNDAIGGAVLGGLVEYK